MNNIPFLPISQHKMVFYPPLWACILCLWDDMRWRQHKMLCYLNVRFADVDKTERWDECPYFFEDFLKTSASGREWKPNSSVSQTPKAVRARFSAPDTAVRRRTRGRAKPHPYASRPMTPALAASASTTRDVLFDRTFPQTTRCKRAAAHGHRSVALSLVHDMRPLSVCHIGRSVIRRNPDAFGF